MDPMNSRDVLPKNVPGVGWGGVSHAGMGWGGSCRAGVGDIGVGWVMQGWDQVSHAEVGWGGSCRGGVGHEVGQVM